MSRVKRGTVTKQRHKRLLKHTKGFWGQRKNIFRRAKETLLRAWAYAYVGRKLCKRNYRKMFIARVSAGCKENGISYSAFTGKLKKMKIDLNRKMLSQLAIFEPQAFTKLVEMAKGKIS